MIRNVKYVGSVGLFFVSYSVLTIAVYDFGVVGIKRLLAFLIAGSIFEIISFFLRKKLKLKSFFGTIVSITILPLIAASLISWDLAKTLPNELLSMILIAFLVSGVVSTISIVVWHFVKVLKPVIKLKTYLGNLN